MNALARPDPGGGTRFKKRVASVIGQRHTADRRNGEGHHGLAWLLAGEPLSSGPMIGAA